LRRLAERSGFPGDALIVRFVDHDAVPAHLAAADFAVTPVKPVPTKRCCTPIKDGEYWAMGLPVVITPGISEDSEIIRRRGIGAVLEGFAPEHYRAALRRIDELLREVPPDELRARIRATAVEFRGFERADAAYRGVYGKGAG